MIQAGDTSMCWGDDKYSGYAGRKDSLGPLGTCNMPATRLHWHAYCVKRGSASRLLYSEHRHYWYTEDYSVISMPKAVMDNYGDLVAVP